MSLKICTMFQGPGTFFNIFEQADRSKQGILGVSPQQSYRIANTSRTQYLTTTALMDGPKLVFEPCSPKPSTKPWQIKSDPTPQKTGLSRLLMLLLNFCLPIGGSLNQESSSPGSCRPVLVCLPTAPTLRKPKKEEDDEFTPVGVVTRNKEADFIGGKLINRCTCGRRNGLGSTDCPRISCQNNPGCLMNPPRCWPQIKEPKKPSPPPPDQNMICVPIELVYYDPSKSSIC